MKTILIDLDNTLVETSKFQLTEESKKLWDGLKNLDVKIVGFTSRPTMLKPFTLIHLKLLGIKLDKLIMNKPRGDVYIGNRAVNFDCRYSDADNTIFKIKKVLEKYV